MEEPKIKVGIMSAAEVKFILDGDFHVSDNTVSGSQVATTDGKSIIWNNKEYTELFFEPANDEVSFWLEDVTIGVNFHWERKENQRFKGALKLIVENGKITPINILGVEDYLLSVISSEMSATASLELLKAHAVISRSWLLAQIDKNKRIVDAGEQYSAVEKTSDDVKMYKYGTFANKKITIKVPISDGGDAPSSGYRSAEMIYVGEYGSENKYVANKIENGYAYFEIPEQTEGDFVYEGTMTVTLTDNVGNSTVSDTLLSPAPYESGYLVVENIAPSVSDTPVLKGENMYSKDVDGETQLWFSSDVNLDYSITDMESGISHVVIERKHDNKSDEIENSVYTELTDLTRNAPHTVSTETGVDGKFEFHVIGSQSVIEASTDEAYKISFGYLSVSFEYVHGIPDHIFLALVNRRTICRYSEYQGQLPHCKILVAHRIDRHFRPEFGQITACSAGPRIKNYSFYHKMLGSGLSPDLNILLQRHKLPAVCVVLHICQFSFFLILAAETK